MLKTILGKTLFEKRWTILIWFGATLASVFGIAMIFPPIRDSMGAMMGQVPESMRGWFGDAETWQTYNGFASQEIFSQMALLPIIMAIVFGAAFLAGEENSRTLLTTLSRPIRRTNLLLQKYAALIIMLLIVMLAFWLGAILGGVILNQPIDWTHFAEATLMTGLLSLALGTITFAIGAITGRKSLAGLIVGFYAFIAYFISSLSTATDIVDKLSYGSLFRYARAPEIFANGLNNTDVLVLALAIIIPLLIAIPIFRQRDLNTR
jgi:ABC-2 type transport system permease protein